MNICHDMYIFFVIKVSLSRLKRWNKKYSIWLKHAGECDVSRGNQAIKIANKIEQAQGNVVFKWRISFHFYK